MSALATNPCTDDLFWCNQVWNRTENEFAAQAADFLIGRPLAITMIVVVALFLRWLLHRGIDRLVRRAETGVVPGRMTRITLGSTGSGAVTRRVQRAGAMGSLLKSVTSGVILVFAGVMALAELDVNIGPLIAGAGIVGVALGFGAQSLVKDFLSGIFMIFEDQYGVGDVIDTGEASGTVEAVSLRVTRLRDVSGTVWYVRNGEILRVGNMSQNWARTVLDIGVAYSEDLVKVRRVLGEVAHDLWEDEEFKGLIIEQPEVWGVQDLSADAVTVRVTLKTAPMEQWAVAREMRERIKARFDFEGIEIPFPQRVVWHRDDAAHTPPAGDDEVASGQ
ncbi:mechanosensitive ion channel family protein [Nocardioides sp.]|uniref:mechanosensitive ion channel family protein n=1 Tax=Nocardioides sp. TaxID=35761 RepID=UPI002732E4AB|nr:mechanosensitive ion channel family protein [Nocardioides sp.]MDP3894037.1 mechanosensitive ion channel family protein [Nocardioides sp.]